MLKKFLNRLVNKVTIPEFAQLAGASALGVGLFVVFGAGIGLIVTGVLAVGAGVFLEIGGKR